MDPSPLIPGGLPLRGLLHPGQDLKINTVCSGSVQPTITLLLCKVIKQFNG